MPAPVAPRCNLGLAMQPKNEVGCDGHPARMEMVPRAGESSSWHCGAGQLSFCPITTAALSPAQMRKVLGVEMGAPWHLHCMRLDEQGVVVRSNNYTLYGDMSAA